MLSQLSRVTLDMLFPQWCVGCGREGDYMCRACRQSLLSITPPICPRCGRPHSGAALCTGCTNWSTGIDGIRSPFVFQGVLRKAIHELKYRNLRALAVPLAELLYEYLTANPLPGEVLVPVPLHRKRMRERGYNQSQLLARELSKIIGLPVLDNCLVRQLHSSPQARTTRVSQRQSNVAGAFACRGESLRDKKVLLIDDVSTSGATLGDCAGVLKAAGAVSVWGLVMAEEL
ncbi:ComF family protein [Chloroflexota bacterium]